MNTPTPKISPLRQRMIEDMRIRKLEPKTQSGSIRAVRHFTVWYVARPIRLGLRTRACFKSCKLPA
jgi:integrase/recombinase XerD